ncbi:MAG: pyridoxal phosphate-dependent aminotransferase [Euryarchaeota archaeon]|nr:pyridoxal phosphate-dependent aminotransferase [Euryarchaeota archaeon]
MAQPSRRLDPIRESATVRMADRAAELKAQGRDILSLTLGEPDFPTPPHILDAADRAARAGKTHYTPSGGIPELRQAIAEKLQKENRIPATSKQVLVTAGAKMAIYQACQAILEKGDRAVLLDPAWVTLDACIRMAGARTTWARDPGKIPEKIGPRTKLVILNSPSNPSGGVLPEETIRAVRDAAVEHDCYVLSDEIYEKIIYEGTHRSIGSMDGMMERTITVNGFSKAYAMTGWRLGYAHAPPPVLGVMMKLQQHTVTCATAPAQHAGVEALRGPQDTVARMVEEFRARRDLLLSGLWGMGMRPKPPVGAFYLWLDVRRLGGGARVAEALLEKAGVAVTPGDDFGPRGKHHIRVSYAASRENLSEFLRRAAPVLSASLG